MSVSIPAGRINKLFGTDGGVMLSLYADFPADFDTDTPLLVTIDALEVPLWCERFERRGASGAVAAFADFDTERRAQELLGLEFRIRFDEEDDDEFYMEDLIGFAVTGFEMRHGGTENSNSNSNSNSGDSNEDANGGSNEISTTYRLQGLVPVTEKSYDLWANTVTLQVVDFTRSANVTFGLCGSDGQWKYQTGTSQGDDFISATFAPQWQESTNANGHTVYTRETGTGVVATHGYDYKVTIDGTEKSGSFTAGAAQTIPNADMSGWSMTSGFAFPNAEGGSFWSSGNNTMTKTLCTSTDVKFGKAAPAAKLTSTNMLVLAAGNLFTGTFAYKSFTGTVQFGQPYDFTVRPSALKVKYHAKVGTVDKVRTSGDICPYIKKGDPDMARIFVAIVDWNAPHQVVSAMTTTKGAWDPEKGIDNVSEGKILGYGSLWITQSTEGDDMQDAELEIVWYDHETRPSGGGYSLVISCACNAYGDYFTGCSTNVMYVDDFEWGY